MAIGVIEAGLHMVALAALTGLYLQFGVDDELGIAVTAVEDGADADIADADARRSEERHRTVNTSQPPHVLVFKVAAVTVFEYLEGEMMEGSERGVKGE